MKHILFGSSSDTLTTALLIKEHSMMSTELYKHYINDLSKSIPLDELCAFSLKYEPSGKVSAKQAKDYLQILLPALNSLSINTLLVADSGYFKYLTGVTKVEPHYGYILPCSIKGFEHISCILSVNYGALFYNPDLKFKLDMSISTAINHIDKSHVDIGLDIIHIAHYPTTGYSKIKTFEEMLEFPALTCDIETSGLRFNESEIVSIGFAWDKHCGVSFMVDNPTLLLLAEFFEIYTGELWFHNALFDVKFLIYHLYMETSTDYKGMRHGLEVFRHVNDTMLYCYLALNSTADIKLGLKPNSFEYTGNYALDDEKIHDVQSMDSDLLLKYNLTDCLATWFVKEKYEPKVIADNQMDTYTSIMQPSLVPLLEMMLVGLPIDLSKVTSAKIKLEAVRDIATRIVKASPVIKKTQFALQMKAMREANASLKKKVKSLDEFKDLLFNPGSSLQLSYLLYDVLKLPVVDLTKTKQPATGQKTLKKLVAHTNDEKTTELLEALIELAQSSKILNDFIANFQLLHFRRDDGTTWLNGDQVLGGTQSGRLSARNPNLEVILKYTA